jgi:hypothetical protein
MPYYGHPLRVTHPVTPPHPLSTLSYKNSYAEIFLGGTEVDRRATQL